MESGFDPEDLCFQHPSPDPIEVDEARIVADLVGSEGLTAKRSTFDPRDVLRGICEAVPGGADVDLGKLLQLGRAVVRNQDTVPMLGSASLGERTYSTTDMLAAEASALRIVADRREAASAVVPSETVDILLTKDTLVDEQAQLVRDLTSSKAGVDIVVGPAGAGKTRALRVAREAWEAAGHTVIGASLAAVAA